MGVVIKLPRNTEADLRAAIRFGNGDPFHVVYRDTDDLFLYPYDTDVEDVSHKISRFLSTTYRRKQGHEAFVRVHKFFNEEVILQNDPTQGYTRAYCSYDQLKQLRGILD